MNKRIIITLVLAVSLVVLSFGFATAQDSMEVGDITQRIIDRGELICGANANVQGFGFLNEAGEFVGFDIDYCRAVAAAVLGDSTAVSFRPLTGAERQAAMQSGEIDMMARNTTWTISRDVTWGAIFGPTTFYDGQGVMVPVELGVASIPELDGGSICVQSGTTTELNMTDYVEANGLDIELQVFPDANSTWDAYVAGRCEGFTTDKSGLAAFRSTADDPGAHAILAETISKEPLGPLSPQSDPQFAEIVAWTAFGLVTAEELGISSENINDYLQGDMSDEDYISEFGPVVARFLGQANTEAGSFLGLENDFMVTVIEQVGNYGEIYERNLSPLGLVREGSPNALWTEGGLLYAPPFR